VIASVSKLERVSPEAFDQFVSLPENLERRFELIAGDVVEMVSNPESSMVTARLTGYLFMYLQRHPIGVLTAADGGYVIGTERYIPDIGFITNKKLQQLPLSEAYLSVAPDLAVEVLSPGNAERTIRVKITNYLAMGTTVWIIDPPMRRVEVYEPGKMLAYFSGSDTLNGGTVLPGFLLSLDDLWPTQISETEPPVDS